MSGSTVARERRNRRLAAMHHAAQHRGRYAGSETRVGSNGSNNSNGIGMSAGGSSTSMTNNVPPSPSSSNTMNNIHNHQQKLYITGLANKVVTSSPPPSPGGYGQHHPVNKGNSSNAIFVSGAGVGTPLPATGGAAANIPMRRPASPSPSLSHRPPMMVSPQTAHNMYTLSLSTSRSWENNTNNNSNTSSANTTATTNAHAQTTEGAPPSVPVTPSPSSNFNSIPAALQQPQLTLAPRYRALITPRSSSDNRSIVSDNGNNHNNIGGVGAVGTNSPTNNAASNNTYGFFRRTSNATPTVPSGASSPSWCDRSVASESNLRILGTVSSRGHEKNGSALSRNNHINQRTPRGSGGAVPADEMDADMDARSLHSVRSDSRASPSCNAGRRNSLTREEIRRLATQRLQQGAAMASPSRPSVIGSSASLPGDCLLTSPPMTPSSPRWTSSTQQQQQQVLYQRAYSPLPQQQALSMSMTFDDDVSSLGGVEDQTSAVQRITLALKNKSARPSSLTREERALWDAIQSVVKQAKSENGSSGNSRTASNSGTTGSSIVANPMMQQQEQTQPPQSPSSSAGDWKQKYTEILEKTESQERDHFASLRAIQRVLADVTAERDAAVKERKKLQRKNDEHEAVTETREAPPQDDNIEELRKEVQSLRQQLSSKDSKIRELELQLSDVREESSTHGTSPESIRERLDVVEAERNRLASEVKSNVEELSELSRKLSQQQDESKTSSTEVADLRRQLSEKLSALENAKMIIASLESASGSLAADMRAKLKGKEDEVSQLKKDAADRQKTLDSLAMELRELQRSRSNSRFRQRMDEERSRRLGLSSRLEKNMAEIRAAAVVLESTNDPTTADQIANLLGDSISALRDGIDVIEEAEDSSVDGQSTASCADSVSVSSSRGPAPVDVRRLRKELDDRARALHHMEETLRREREENAKLRTERDSKSQSNDEVLSLRKEVTSLREQCKTNMEVLARKERELAVLRDSLKVDDGVGYISDDGSDSGTESDAGTEAAVSSAAQFAHYGPSQAEALATLLAHRNNSSSATDTKDPNELLVLKRELLQAKAEIDKNRKQLKTEKESLANAKMIISSLEKANKSMMEDLRSRLQDSNTAIASLLEKSMQSEKNTAKLRDELEALRNEKEEERARYESELKKLQIEVYTPSSSDHKLEVSSLASQGTAEEKKVDFLSSTPTETID